MAYLWPFSSFEVANFGQFLQILWPISLQPLPTVDQPNQHIHIDLFGPLKTSEKGNKMVLVMTDAFTKYAEAIAILDKQAETVAMEIFIHWICAAGKNLLRQWYRICK